MANAVSAAARLFDDKEDVDADHATRDQVPETQNVLLTANLLKKTYGEHHGLYHQTNHGQAFWERQNTLPTHFSGKVDRGETQSRLKLINTSQA